MLDFPDETIVQILAALPYAVILSIVVRVCRKWHELRSSAHFLDARAAVDERGLMVAGGTHTQGSESAGPSRQNYVRVGGRWCERAPLLHSLHGSSASFGEELVLFGEGLCDGEWKTCCRAFNLEANAGRTLEWEHDRGPPPDPRVRRSS